MRQAVTVLMALLLLAGMAYAGDRGKDSPSEFSGVQTAAPPGMPSGWLQVPLELTTTNYKSIDYLPSGAVWAVGYSTSTNENLGFRSTDHGATWTRFTIHPAQTTTPGMSNVSALDNNNALISLYTGKILRTTNGGAKWDTVYSHPLAGYYINWLKYVNSTTAIAIGDGDPSGVLILRSTNVGATWTRVTGFPTDADSLNAADFWASSATLGQAGSAAGDAIVTTWYSNDGIRPSLFMMSTDAGLTWTKTRGNNFPDSAAANNWLRSINIADANNWYAVVGDNYLYYRTTNAGASWVAGGEMQPGGPVHTAQRPYSIKPVAGTSVVVSVGDASGVGARTWWSTNGGTTFTPYYVPSGGTNALRTSAFISATQGFAAGYKNVVQYTAQYPVTFRVNMKVKIKEGVFNKATDTVTIRGSFNDWGNSGNTDLLSPLAAPNDSTYSITKMLSAAGPVDYKFWASSAGLAYENIASNRSYNVPEGGGVVPTVYFNNDSVVSIASPVTFQVNMRVKFLEQVFTKATGVVTVRGSFNDWGNSTPKNGDTLTALAPPNDSIYAKTITLYSGDTVKYKFWATGGIDYETITDRKYGIKVGAQTIPAPLFNNDSVINSPITTNIFWNVNARTYILLGWFDPIKDSMGVQGDFTGWSNSAIPQDLTNPEVYGDIRSYTGTVGDIKRYKFFMKRDSLTAIGRWGSYYAGNKDGFNYEHPAELGDGNNSYEVINAPNQTANQMWFSGISPQGIIPANDSINVTFTVNMGPAKRYSDPFVPGADTVYVHFRDALWIGSQKASQGASFGERKKMALAPGGGDSIYTVTMKVKGPTHYNVMYTYQYYHGAGGNVDIGGGLGATYQFITRFIRRADPGPWTDYSFPQDTWKDAIPLYHETAQFPLAIPGEGVYVKPLAYSLDQNYPNPFNPSTQIKYSLPEAAKVTLKVFNILGQEVLTLVNEVRQAGSYVSLFEGHSLASGVYFYRLEAGKFSQTKKMLLLK